VREKQDSSARKVKAIVQEEHGSNAKMAKATMQE